MALPTLKQIRKNKRGETEALYDMIVDVSEGEMEDGAVETADIADENVTLDKIEDLGGEAQILVADADKRPVSVAMSGDVAISSLGVTTIQPDAVEQGAVANDAIGAAELKVVERNITIAAEAAAGSVTNAADANGIILGVIPYAACESAILDVSFTTATGEITVTLGSAQSAETPATVTAVVLQA